MWLPVHRACSAAASSPAGAWTHRSSFPHSPAAPAPGSAPGPGGTGAFSARKTSGRPLPPGPPAGLAQAAQGVPAHQPAPLLVPVEHIPPGPGGPLAVGDAPPGAAEVAVEQGLHPVFQLLLIQPRGKGEGVQHPPLPVVLRPGLPQGPLEPWHSGGCPGSPDSLVPPPGHGAGGVFPPQCIQLRPVLTGTAVDRPLQSQPEQVGVQLAAELALGRC